MPKCRPIPKAWKMADTEMSADTDTEISAETDTETDNFRSLVMILKVFLGDRKNNHEIKSI